MGRRTSFIFLICLLALSGTVIAGNLASGLVEVGRLRATAVCALAFLLLCTAAGMLAHLRLRKASMVLAEALVRARRDPMALNVASPHAELAPLTSAIQDLINAAGGRLAEAQKTARELDLQLNVVRAEREHAESAVYTISDTVTSNVTPVLGDQGSADASVAGSQPMDMIRKLKNDFVSSVSHELRTPLASIKAYVEMLIDGEAEDEKTKHDFYEVIQNEANRLSRLIDNILNVSKIESGLVQVNRQAQSVAPIVREAIDAIAPQARIKGVAIEEQLAGSAHFVLLDRDLIYQALINLLSNAVKFTASGGRVRIELALDEGRQLIVMRITDSGVGIAARDVPFIFEKFYKVEANNRLSQGTGLGLSLVKHIIETTHGGKVFVQSEVGKGSCFEFELPLCSEAMASAPARSES